MVILVITLEHPCKVRSQGMTRKRFVLVCRSNPTRVHFLRIKVDKGNFTCYRDRYLDALAPLGPLGRCSKDQPGPSLNAHVLAVKRARGKNALGAHNLGRMGGKRVSDRKGHGRGDLKAST